MVYSTGKAYMGCTSYLPYLDPGANDVFKPLSLSLSLFFPFSLMFLSVMAHCFIPLRWERAHLNRCWVHILLSRYFLKRGGILSSCNRIFPEKDSDWMSLSHVPIPEPIAVARDTPIGQVGENLSSRNGHSKKHQLLLFSQWKKM